MIMSNLPSVEPKNRNRMQESAPTKTVEPVKQPEPEGYVSRKVDVKMTRQQAEILRDKLRKLQDSGAKTADGVFVTNKSQAVRWILENEVKL